jgi:hypothetical protein
VEHGILGIVLDPGEPVVALKIGDEVRLGGAQLGERGPVGRAQHGVAVLRGGLCGCWRCRVGWGGEQRQRGKSDHDVSPFAAEPKRYAALRHAGRDGVRLLRDAEEYVRKAPVQIATPYRRAIEQALGWTAI